MSKDGIKVKNKGKIDYNKSLQKIFDNKKFRAIVAQVAVKGIKDGLQAGKDIHGRAFKRLKVATVKQKKKKGYRSPSKPLIATGVMKKLPPVINKTGHAELSVAKSRTNIALYHNEGGSKGNNPPKREWFGITVDAKTNIQRAIAKKFVSVLKKGFKLPSKL